MNYAFRPRETEFIAYMRERSQRLPIALIKPSNTFQAELRFPPSENRVVDEGRDSHLQKTTRRLAVQHDS
ncbi:hypothetical protein FPSE_09459 [Fusarium pseudograminearum CS3096]|uniref:Uncharacterized protein n=1 Tax=Fusarium pseudograminearum (strain CS3096) TaxID=1028729 RepID=K3V9B1_FUSPC|nr:hypothetical protein FPSE_09459 [Fusarium pseudograminearum CS3096]EKJ70242.1 hypothetical protein FPSE_09459 [Fusarium pseudograminearum CS3096]